MIKENLLLTNLSRVWLRLSTRRRKQVCALFVLMLLSAFVEVVSLGAVLPFLAALVDPAAVIRNSTFAATISRLGIHAVTVENLTAVLTGLFVIAVLIAALIRLLLLWASTRLSFAIGVDLSVEMFRRTLYQPYRVHISRNSSEVVGGITVKVSTVVNGVIFPILMLISSAVVLIALIVMLVLISPLVAFTSAGFFGACYILISAIFSRKLKANSEQHSSALNGLFKSISEGLGGIRDVLIDGVQELYSQTYHKADVMLRRTQASNTFIASSPRFLMEGIGMTLIAVIAYGLSAMEHGLSAAIPLLGALAMGAQRLIPTLQQAYSSWSTVVGSTGSLVDAVGMLEQPLPSDVNLPPPAPLPFRERIEFRHVQFRYGDEEPWTIDGLNLVIRKGSRIGIMGETGSGKSTLIDLILGLLRPTQGAIFVDDVEVTESNTRAWQRNLAHVPQSVYLSDASFEENIAFGVPLTLIDRERVRRAASSAQIAEFIETSEGGYRRPVGERGVRLSGGQRQRIGIARALYKDARVLVFDEATSALDQDTEKAVMQSIAKLDRNLTIIMIAHRLTTLRCCDSIICLRGGRIISYGSYAETIGRMMPTGVIP